MLDWKEIDTLDTSFDEARRCLKCGELGAHVETHPGPNRSTVYLFECKNPNCKWFEGAPWIRQRYADGTWVPEQKHNKFFNSNLPDKTDEVQAAIDRSIADQRQR